MFVTAVLAFASGIYLQAISPLSMSVILVALILSAALAALFLRTGAKPVVTALLIAAAFLMAGMLRSALVSRTVMPLPTEETPQLYVGTVSGSTATSAVIRLSDPPVARGTRVLFHTDSAPPIGTRIGIVGTLKELEPLFKNPSMVSWRWLKRLEGIAYELKGAVISRTPGTNPVENLRSYLQRRIEGSGARWTAIIRALTIGDTTALNAETQNLFLRTGTSHILAVSGTNVGIICGFFFFIIRFLLGRIAMLRLAGDHTRYAALCTVPFAFLFMLVAGSGIPVIRASIMVTVVMLALFFERARHAINTIALSALVILLIFPHSLFTPSFQLTFGSVLFIVLSAGPAYRFLHDRNRLLRWFLSGLLVTLAATAGTLPAVLYHFHGFNPFSMLHNLIAVPLMCALAMPLALVGLVVPFGHYLLQVSGLVLTGTVSLLRTLDIGYIYPVIRPSLTEGLAYYGLILGLLFVRRRFARILLFTVILPAVLIETGGVVHNRYFNRDLSIHFIDVGLGQSILIEAPYGRRLLVDGGRAFPETFDTGKAVITPYLLARKILSLDYVINTHPHGDHLGGLFHIVRNFDIRRFAAPANATEEPAFADMMRLLDRRGVPLSFWQAGMGLDLNGKARVSVLHPPAGALFDNLNDASLVLRIDHGGFSALLTGDIGFDVERRFVLHGLPLRARLLQVPHHGSAGANSLAFLAAVEPDLAVLSVGRNVSGLPNSDVIARYAALGIPLLRTDRHGLIRVSSDEGSFSVTTTVPQ